MRRHAMTAATGIAVLAIPSVTANAENLVLYTSQPNKDAQQTVDAFVAKHPNVGVAWIRNGTGKVMAKLRAEFAAGNPWLVAMPRPMTSQSTWRH